MNTHINHESSRKAFETDLEKTEVVRRECYINHESSRKAFETLRATGPLPR